MKNKFRLLVALSFFFAVGCSSDKHDEMDDHAQHEQHEQDDHAGHHHDNSDEPLVLNDGKKWDMNSEMMTIVRSMEKEVMAFNATKLEEKTALGTRLSGQVNELTSSCTMDGQAHDELHKWLLPFIHTINHLKDSETDAEANEYLNDLKESFEEFNQYFE